MSASSTTPTIGVVKIANPNHRSPLYPRRSAVKPIHTANATQTRLGMMMRNGLKYGIKGSTWRTSAESVLATSIGQPGWRTGDIAERQAIELCYYRRPMSVELDFQPEPRAAAEALATHPPELFTETLLRVRVRFRVDGQDLLASRRLPVTFWSVDTRGIATGSEPVVEDQWTWQPVIGLLLGLERAVEEAQRTGASRCYLTEQSALVFRRRSASILEVASGGGATVAAAEFDDFTAAIAGFREAVRTWLEGQAPHLATHPAWAHWFPGRR
jgi:hypothetical protein